MPNWYLYDRISKYSILGWSEEGAILSKPSMELHVEHLHMEPENGADWKTTFLQNHRVVWRFHVGREMRCTFLDHLLVYHWG